MLSYFFSFQETCLSSIVLWTDGKVNPVTACTVALDDQFIKISLCSISNIKQDRGIADGLLKACHSDIYRTTRQVVARCTPPCQLIDLGRPIT